MNIIYRESIVIRQTFVSLALAFLVCAASYPMGAQLTTGLPPFGSFSGGPIDTINLSNLNVHFAFPVFTRGGRGLPFSYSLTYDSSIWNITGTLGAEVWYPNSPYGGVTGLWGWGQQAQPSAGSVAYSHSVKRCPDLTLYNQYTFTSYTDASGTTHVLNPSLIVVDDQTCSAYPYSAQQTAPDGSGYLISVDSTPSTTVTTPSGTVINVPIKATGTNGSIADSNGNFVTLSGGTSFTDTLGTVALTASAVGANPAIYSYPAPNGTQASVQLFYSPYYVQTAFGCTDSSSAPIAEWSSYNQEYLVTKVQMSDGTYYQIAYEQTPGYGTGYSTGRIQSITLPSGGTITYSYQGSNDGVNCIDGSPSHLVRSTPDGTWTYTHTINSNGTGSTTVLDPKGNQTVYSFQNANGTQDGLETQRVVYNGTSTVLATTNTCYNGTVAPCTGVQISLPVARRTVATQADGSAASKVDTFYNSYGMPYETDEYDFGAASPTRKTVVDYATLANNIVDRPADVKIEDSNNNVVSQTTYSYDQTAVAASGATSQLNPVIGSRGNPTTITYPTGLARTFTYFDTGMVQQASDLNGNTTSFGYGGTGGCNYAFPTSVNMPLALLRSATWNCTGGVLASATDENGQTTSYSFDTLYWRITTITYPIGQQTTAYNLTTIPWNITTTTAISSTMNATTKTTFDSSGRVSNWQLTSDPDGTTNVDYAYDADGLLASMSNPYRSTSDPTYGVTFYYYDGLGRLTSQTQPDGNSISLAFSGSSTAHCTTRTDEAGKQTESCDDGLGRLTQVFEWPATLDLETDYGYNILDNLTSVTQKGGTTNGSLWRTRAFAYDALGRMTQATDPESGTMNYYYVSGAALCSGDPTLPCTRTDARNITTTYTYDALNRLTGKSYSDGTPAVTYLYDLTAYNGLTITNGKGRRTGMSDGSGQTAWSYDAMGRVLTKQQTIVGITKSIGYTYNRDGSVASIAYPDGRVFAYAYNNARQPVSVVDTADGYNYVTNAHYTAPGMLSSLYHGQTSSAIAITKNFSYNNRLELTRILATNPVPATLLDYGFTYNQPGGNNGNVVQVNNNLNSARSVAYAYDQLNRLQTAGTYNSTNWGDAYVYDNWGNLLQKNVTQGTAESLTVAVDAHNHIVGDSYDAAGNMTWDQVNAMTYDAENRANPSGGSWAYDGDDHRVKKTDGTIFWTDDSFRVLSVGTTSGAVNTDYVYFNGERIGILDVAAGGDPYYYIADQIGSVRIMTSGGGKVVYADNDYFPWGAEINLETSVDFKFTGYWYDYGTGYNFAGMRNQSTTLGRFLSPDPAGPVAFDPSDPRSLNRYTYVWNDPTNTIDSDGRWPTDVHHYILRQAFPGLSSADLQILIDASDYVDRLHNQGASGANSHSMCEPSQSLDACTAGIAQLISADISTAQQEGFGPMGLWTLGMALHAITDSTSPWHTDPNGNPLCWRCSNLADLNHIIQEHKHAWEYPVQIQKAISLARQQFNNAFPNQAGQAFSNEFDSGNPAADPFWLLNALASGLLLGGGGGGTPVVWHVITY
jgi:RHS repeat-associated protein